MKRITCALIDDEPLALALLESYVKRTPFLQLKGTYSSAIKALPLLQEETVGLLFLDIQMPELSGMDFSRLLQSENTLIIFTTAFSEYAIESYKVNALDYLLKPINYVDFLQAAHKALNRMESSEPERIIVKSEYKLLQIELNDILYIEGLKDYVKIYLVKQKQPILSLMSMKSLEDLLPFSRFVRVHRSFIVQPAKIKVIDRNRIVFDKVYIPISDTYKQRFLDFLAQHSLLP
ncbi:MAG: LytTR family DNA-binding domain-containing protein [Massilibacteroides sp.]|nr:LytTR family DNA-binding domain-containing protein [Massilibacteroides sp.]